MPVATVASVKRSPVGCAPSGRPPVALRGPPRSPRKTCWCGPGSGSRARTAIGARASTATHAPFEPAQITRTFLVLSMRPLCCCCPEDMGRLPRGVTY